MLRITKNDVYEFMLKTDNLGFHFHKKGQKKGTFEIQYNINESRTIYLRNCYSAINFYKFDHIEEFSSKEYIYETKIENFDDSIGNGLKIKFVPSKIVEQKLLFTIQFKIYESTDFILIKLINIEDKNENALSVHSIAPLTIKNSNLWLSGNENASNLYEITWFKNGWQSWSACELFFGEERDNQGSDTEILKMIYDNQDYGINGRFYSEYCTCITDINSKNSLILGFVSLRSQFSRIIIDYENSNELKLLTAFGCMDSVKFKNSNINSSEELFFSFKTKNRGYYGLIDYARIVKSIIKEPRIKSIPIGWCSWYYYFTEITQEEMVKNVEFFKKNRDLPIDFIQLDDGYFTKIGDFTNTNEKFANGLPWLFNYIQNQGFKAGIWTAPFIAIKRSNFFKDHRNWFLTKSEKLLPVLFNWKSFEYSLDLSNNEALDYLKNYFKNLLYVLKNKKNKGEFLKIDFLHAAVPYNADYKNRNVTRAQILYRGIKTIRDAITDDTFLLGCGAPLGPCVGLVDAMRISSDTAPIWDAGFVDQFENKKGITEISLKAALLNTLYRSFMHKYFWINDPDCLMIRRNNTKLTLDEIRLQMTIFGLSGGQILLSDDMTQLSKEEINDAKLLIPPYNSKFYDPIPIDVFNSQYPSIYTLETNEVIGKRYLIAIINWENQSSSRLVKMYEILPFSKDKDKNFFIFDFWNELFLGKFGINDTLELKEIKPHSCRYLSIIPVNNNSIDSPILLSSTLHITQGCYEIRNYEYLDKSKKIQIDIEMKGNRKGYFFFLLPQEKKIDKYPFDFSLIDSTNNIWKLFIKFKDKISLNIYLT